MDVRRKSRLTAGAGFTLIEVTLAVVILASSLVVLLSLQYSSIQRTLRDRTRLSAMLIARNILTAIEADPDRAPDQTRTEPAFALAEDLLRFQYAPEDLDESERRIQAVLSGEKLEIPQEMSNALNLKRIVLRMYWSDDPLDAFEVVYYLPDFDANAGTQPQP